MKIDRYLMKLTFCWLLLTLYACQSSNYEEDTTCEVLLGKMEGEDKSISLEKLSYTLCLFRAIAIEGQTLEDTDYQCIDMVVEQSEEQAKAYSFKISNEEIGAYAYWLFIQATPTDEAETKVVSVEIGSSFDAIEIEMIKRIDGSYVPLSKDNYHASAQLDPEQMAAGKMALQLKLERLVGQLVFDFFKSNDSKELIDIDPEHLSTLDRVTKINMEVKGMTTRIKLAGMVATIKDESGGMTTREIQPKLEEDFRVDASEQKSDCIVEVEKKIAGEVVKPKGGARVFSTYLLPTGIYQSGGQVKPNPLKAELIFSYYDTPSLGNLLPPIKKLTLNLPSQKKELEVAGNCYTVTNIRLKNNRIIDLNASTEVDIDTDWKN